MDLVKILPKDHPYLAKHTIVENANSVADLIDEIESWKRGLCEWDDVQVRIDKVKEDIHEATQ